MSPDLLASSSWLITPDLGLTIWIIVVFGVSLFILSKAVYPRIGQVLDQRAKVINDSIDAAENTRREADQVLAEYRQRLHDARQQAEDILDRARQAAAVHEREARTNAQARGEQLLEQARREIDTESRRAIDDIVRDVADLTVLATERVTRKALTEEDQRRLIEEALADLDFSVLSGGAPGDGAQRGGTAAEP
jgi:F-type H+-transporting ATPase subunit b